MKNCNTINRKLIICNLARAITCAFTFGFIICGLAFFGEPAPGEESLSVAKIIVGEAICFAGVVFFGKLFTTLSECAVILKKRINKSRG